MILGTNIAVAQPQQWQTLPPTPTLPQTLNKGYANINGVKIWYALYGQGTPVILLHGGLANSNYWGKLIPVLASHYQVIVMDSRCHGRSTCNNQTLSYDLMASDVLGLMNTLKINQTAIVGWSDGANIGLTLAITHPERISKLFAFGANSNPDGIYDVSKNPVINAYEARTRLEYQQLSPQPQNYTHFLAQMNHVWSTEPNFTTTQLANIKVPTWIVDGDRDEGIKRSNTEYMAQTIPNAGLLIEPEVSHFAFLQDPEQFNQDVLHFLTHVSKE